MSNIWGESPLYLGHQGENLARTKTADVSAWLAEWPGATFVLAVTLPGSVEAYIADTSVSGNTLSWPVTAGDTSYAGTGMAELRAYSGETLVKSDIIRTQVDAAMGTATGPVPPAAPDWVTTIITAVTESAAAASTAEAAATAAETSADAAAESSAAAATGAGLYWAQVGPAASLVAKDAAAGMAMRAVTVTIEAAQSGSGTPSPSNIRAITGYQSAVITIAGGGTSRTATVAIPATPGTVYGGVIDMDAKKLTVTHQIAVLTGAETVKSGTAGGYTRFYIENKFGANSKDSGLGVCSHYNVAANPMSQNDADLTITARKNSKNIYWRDDSRADATAAKAYLLAQYQASTPVTLVAPLATPVEYDITPAVVELYGGDNTISAACGTVAGEYCTDASETAMHTAALMTGMEEASCTWAVGSINFNSGGGTDLSSTTRIRSNVYIDLSTRLIESTEMEFSLYCYDRSTAFLGVWNGAAPVYGVSTWMKRLDLTRVYSALESAHPNPLFRIIARHPDDSTCAATDGADVHFLRFGGIPDATLSMFRTWAVCGASYDSGSVNHYDYSWPQILARRCGNTCTNYSFSGATVLGWYNDTSEHGFAQMIADDPAELYVLTFGGNDASHFADVEPLGTIADITGYEDWHDYPQTFYGTYGKVIEQLLAHAPDAFVILTTPSSPWYSANQSSIDTAVREIAAHYSLPLIVWESDDYMRSNAFTGRMISNHPTPIAYSGMALAFERLFSKATREYPAYFYVNLW